MQRFSSLGCRAKALALALAILSPLPTTVKAQTISLEIVEPQSAVDKNFRLAGTAGFSVSFVPDQYRLYATTHIPRLKWKTQTALDDFYYKTKGYGWPTAARPQPTPIPAGVEHCAIIKDPSEWNRRCIDSIGLFTKRLFCTFASNPNYSCEGNSYWNAAPGRSNVKTFPDYNLWPRRDGWGVTNFTPVIDKESVNAVRLLPPDPADATRPPPTGAHQLCHPHNPYSHATGAANPKVVQVKYADGAKRWFMAFNSQIHSEQNVGDSGNDKWRVLWAYSADGFQWTVHPQVLFRSTSEAGGGCMEGLIVTAAFTDDGHFYVLFHESGTDRVYMARSPVAPASTSVPGYDAAAGWSVAGAADPSTGRYEWIPLTGGRLGAQLDWHRLGARSIFPSRYSPHGFMGVKQSAIARVFASATPHSASKYVGLTVDKPGDLDGIAQRDVFQVWATEDLNKSFTYQSDINIPASLKLGGYGFEFGFTHYVDNTADSPRVAASGFDLWFVEDLRAEPNTALPPGVMNTAVVSVSRRKARLRGDIYGN